MRLVDLLRAIHKGPYLNIKATQLYNFLSVTLRKIEDLKIRFRILNYLSVISAHLQWWDLKFYIIVLEMYVKISKFADIAFDDIQELKKIEDNMIIVPLKLTLNQNDIVTKIPLHTLSHTYFCVQWVCQKYLLPWDPGQCLNKRARALFRNRFSAWNSLHSLSLYFFIVLSINNQKGQEL